MTVKKLIKGLKKYHPDMEVIQGGSFIKAMRIWKIPDEISPNGRYIYSYKTVVRLIREDEKRA